MPSDRWDVEEWEKLSDRRRAEALEIPFPKGLRTVDGRRVLLPVAEAFHSLPERVLAQSNQVRADLVAAEQRLQADRQKAGHSEDIFIEA